MKEKEGRYLSSDGATEVAYYVWTPDSPPRAVFQIVHGMCEYVKRYMELVEFLCENGVVVCGADCLGHGATAADDADLGYFGENDGGARLVEDTHLLYKKMRERYKRLPYVLFGHSMGSFVVRACLTDWGGELDGAVVCGTSGTNKKIGFGIFLSGLIAKLRGGRFRSKLLYRISNGGLIRGFDGDTGFEWLSKDTSVLKKYKDDRNCRFIFTARAYNDMFRLLREVSGPEWAEAVPKSLPLFLISGADDPLGARGAGVTEVYDLLVDAEVNDVRMKLYESDRHEILNETDRETVRADILAFIGEVCEGVYAARAASAFPFVTPPPDIPDGGKL